MPISEGADPVRLSGTKDIGMQFNDEFQCTSVNGSDGNYEFKFISICV